MNTEESVVALLDKAGVIYTVQYVGETKRKDWNDQLVDEWAVKFAKGKQVYETEFYTGMGLRKPGKKKWDSDYGTFRNKPEPEAPTSASVLHCLVMDASALDTSFHYWCRDYGYDNDSIKALNTYNECCKIGLELRQLFDYADLLALRELLQDY